MFQITGSTGRVTSGEGVAVGVGVGVGVGVAVGVGDAVGVGVAVGVAVGVVSPTAAAGRIPMGTIRRADTKIGRIFFFSRLG
jgi:hypothetical protein